MGAYGTLKLTMTSVADVSPAREAAVLAQDF